MGVNHLNVGRVDPRFGHQVMLDGHHHLALDEQLGLADQKVQREIHRAFQAVLDGHHTLFQLSRGHGFAHCGDSRVRTQFSRRVVEQAGFFSVSARRTEKSEYPGHG